MSISYLKLAVASCVLVAATVVPVAAQTVGANLTFLREEGDETGVGVAVDVAKNLNPNIGVVGEFGLNTFDGYNIQSYLGGVRFSPAVQASFQPFVQALVGLERFGGEGFESESAFAFQIGAGVEVPVNDSLRFRAQYDFRRTDYDGEGFNGHRFGVGVVFPLGGN